jgi:UDP-N-acetylglucosamine--N-acetylmuramyl-(pentapeptide) pyrophosphoryl-undecaprenol N-acetylglucosamine transferase
VSPRVLLAGGGSGGHVFPLVAVAEALRREASGVEITFVGTASGMEATLLPKRGERLELLEILPIKGGGLRGAVRGVTRAVAVLPEARALVRRLDPGVVLSIGGYAAGPVGVGAFSLGVPVALLEPNSVPGLSNRLLSPFVRRAYTVFPEAERRFRSSTVRCFGLPLRPGFAPSDYVPQEGKARVVLLGGSQGAAALNEAMPAAVARVQKEIPWLTVLHQAGKGRGDEVRRRYDEVGGGTSVEVREFVDDVPAELTAADVVVTRAGAGAICEVCLVGRAAIYVPYPHAADDHQRKNAEALAEAEAGVCVRQEDASPERLAQELIALLLSAPRRKAMADAARSRGRPGAEGEIARDLLGLLRHPAR